MPADPSDPPPNTPPHPVADEWADPDLPASTPALPSPLPPTPRGALPPRRLPAHPAPNTATHFADVDERHHHPPAKSRLPEPTPPRARSKPEVGVNIDVHSLPTRKSPPLPPEPPPAEGDVVKLEASGPTFQAKQTLILTQPLSSQPPRNLHGESSEWGHKPKQSNRWMAAAAISVIALLIAAVVVQELWINKSRKVTSVASTFQPEGPIQQVEGFELEGSSEPDARKLLETYAKATRIEEVIPLIRNGQSLTPRLELDWQPWNPPSNWQGIQNATWSVSSVGARGHGILIGVKPDFSNFRAYFVRDHNTLKIDWEATQGLSDADFPTLVRGVGSGGLVRAKVKPFHYYTQLFPEDTFRSYRLSSPDGEEVVWGYAPIGSKSDEKLLEFFQPSVILDPTKNELPVTLRLEPAPNNAQKNQWLISEMVHIEWVSP